MEDNFLKYPAQDSRVIPGFVVPFAEDLPVLPANDSGNFQPRIVMHTKDGAFTHYWGAFPDGTWREFCCQDFVLCKLQLDIVVGAEPALSPGDAFTFTLHAGADSAVNTYEYLDTFDPSPPVAPGNYFMDFTGNNATLGYRQWWTCTSEFAVSVPATFDAGNNRWDVFMSRAAVLALFAGAGFPELTADHGTFDLARTNTDGNPYDGRGIGKPSLYIDGFFDAVQDVESLTNCYIVPFEAAGTPPPNPPVYH